MRHKTVARKSIMCPLDQGGLGLIDFKSKGEALRLSTLVKSLTDPAFKCLFNSIFLWFVFGPFAA